MQGIPLRSGEIVAQLLERLPTLLGEDIGELMQRLDDALSSSSAAIFAQPACCRDSQRVLSRNRGQALPVVVDSLRRGCEVLAAAPRGARIEGPAPGRPQVLRLQDEDSLEEEATVASIVRRHASRAGFPLLLLGQRCGVLFARPALDADALPVGPLAFCRALGQAADRIGLCAHARLVLYRLYDVECADQYPRFAEALDAMLDDAGILRGLAYVPLRRNKPVATEAAKASEQDAVQSVNRAAEAMAPREALPPRMRSEREEGIFAIARYLLRHGRDSSQWSECIGIADALLEAAHAGGEVPEAASRWLRRAIGAVGYAAGDAGRLAAGLTTRMPAAAPPAAAETAADTAPVAAVDAHAGAVAHVATATGGTRERRCFERLLQLDPDATFGFSAGDGSFIHLCLREQLRDPARMLLASRLDGREIVFEVGMLARLVASGQAWVVRAPATVAVAGVAS